VPDVHTMGTEIAIPEVALRAQDNFPSEDAYSRYDVTSEMLV
jgi:hypothetical protein